MPLLNAVGFKATNSRATTHFVYYWPQKKKPSGTTEDELTNTTTDLEKETPYARHKTEIPHESLEMEMPVDPIGDYFGDYADHSLAELGLDDDEGFVYHSALIDEDDEEADECEVSVEEERGLEPRRPENGQSGDNNNDSPSDGGGAMRLRGGAEIQLQEKPYVVKFTKGKAGAVYSQDGINLNTEYTNSLGESDNPYKPFTSKMEWEIACWAKTRGPSSTAFTELMKIEGVSFSCQDLKF